MAVNNFISFPVKDEPKTHALYDSDDKYITTIYNLDQKFEIVKRVNMYDKMLDLIQLLSHQANDEIIEKSCDKILNEIKQYDLRTKKQKEEN